MDNVTSSGHPASGEDLRIHAGEPVVDTRTDAAAGCAALATAAVDRTPIGDSFVLVSDHDPVAISYMLRAERAGQTSWDVLESGPARWQVRIGRVAAGKDAASHAAS